MERVGRVINCLPSKQSKQGMVFGGIFGGILFFSE